MPSLKAQRSRKRELQKQIEKELGHWSYFSTYDPQAPIRLTLEGDQIGTDSGDAEAIGLLIQRASRFLVSLGARPRLQSLSFAKSVNLEFRAADAEADTAARHLQEAERLARAAGDNPTEDAEDEIAVELRSALTSVVVASTLASALVATPTESTPESAVELGSEVAQAYKTLANAVVRSDVTLTFEAPDGGATRLTPSKARQVAEELREATEPREFDIAAFGMLSIADKEHHGFGLRLDADVARHPALRNKRVISGTYRPELEAKIIEEGLWGREVKATLHVVRDALISTSTIRPASFTLVDVEPRHAAG